MSRTSIFKRLRRWLKPSHAWLYRSQTLPWLSERATVDQFPRPFRFLFFFYRVQHRLGIGVPIFGGVAFRAASRLYRARYGRQPIKLEMYGACVYLHPEDPRMLAVPGELQGLREDDTLLCSVLQAGDTFVDVGANHGTFSIAAAKIVGPDGMVIALEPQPTHADLTDRGLAATNSAPYKVWNRLCGDRNEPTTFYVSSGSSGKSSTFAAAVGHTSQDTFEICATTLDDLLCHETLPGHPVIKLDVEGGEIQAIRGARSVIQRRRPTLVLEVNDAALRHAGKTVTDIADELRDLGYRHFRWCDDPGVARDLAELSPRGKADIVVAPDHKGECTSSQGGVPATEDTGSP